MFRRVGSVLPASLAVLALGQQQRHVEWSGVVGETVSVEAPLVQHQPRRPVASAPPPLSGGEHLGFEVPDPTHPQSSSHGGSMSLAPKKSVGAASLQEEDVPNVEPLESIREQLDELLQQEQIDAAINASSPGTILSESSDAAAVKAATTHPHDEVPSGMSKIEKSSVRYVNPHEHVALAYQKYRHLKSQDGAFLGSTKKEREISSVDSRSRRAIERVEPFKAPWKGYDVSFRRLPKTHRMPQEYQLKALYPQRCELKLEWDEAHCADESHCGPLQRPEPIRYAKILPPDYDPEKEYPYLVALADKSGLHRDVEDVVCNFFERGPILRQMQEQGMVIFLPLISVQHQHKRGGQEGYVEGVIARFCDWVAKEHKVENGKVHLWGKGNGGHAVLKTCLEFKGVAQSATAIVGGRMNRPFHALGKPMKKASNLNGTHLLIIAGGLTPKLGFIYQYKGFADVAQVEPPVRLHHYADVTDHQLLFALNPYEWGAHMKYFRTNDALVEKQEADPYDPRDTWGQSVGGSKEEADKRSATEERVTHRGRRSD